MVPKQITVQEFQQKISQAYKGKTCSLSIPGYETVNGLVDEITLNVSSREPEVIIQMNDRRYTVSPESISECLKQLR